MFKCVTSAAVNITENRISEHTAVKSTKMGEWSFDNIKYTQKRFTNYVHILIIAVDYFAITELISYYF
jgi:hypothetical protein